MPSEDDKCATTREIITTWAETNDFPSGTSDAENAEFLQALLMLPSVEIKRHAVGVDFLCLWVNRCTTIEQAKAIATALGGLP